jgi:hypothetical protein
MPKATKNRLSLFKKSVVIGNRIIVKSKSQQINGRFKKVKIADRLVL